MNPDFETGLRALETADYSAAHRAFNAICQTRPDPRAEGYRAWAKYQMVRERSAGEVRLSGVAKKNCKSVLRAAIAKVPDFDAGYVFLGRILLDEGDSQQASEQFKRALKINRNNEPAALYLEQARGRLLGANTRKRVALERWWEGIRSRFQTS